MNKDVTVLGVDIGGTKIAAGRVCADSAVAGAFTLPTRAAEGLDVSLAQLWTTIDQALDSTVRAIGMCAPGPLDSKTGIIINPPNLPGWIDLSLVEMTAKKFGLRET